MSNSKKRRPPFAAKLILRWATTITLKDSYLGDLDEAYHNIYEQKGLFRAYVWYWLQSINALPGLIKHSLLRGLTMYKNYVKIAFRNILKHKGYSFINVAGLALGMACTILIVLWVQDEFSYDSFHEHADNLYRVEQDQNYSGNIFRTSAMPTAMASALIDEIPEVVNATRFIGTGSMLIRYQEKAFFEGNIRGVDPSFFSMFSYSFLAGEGSVALNDPFSVVITEAIAEKYFGEEPAVGKVLSVNNQYDLTVTGVIENTPVNSIVQFSMVMPYEFLKSAGLVFESWGSNSIRTFVQLIDNVPLEETGEKITRSVYVHRNSNENGEFTGDVNNITGAPQFVVEPLTDIHLYGHSGFAQSAGNIQYVYIFSAIALFVLLIACINFMNLSTARSANRAKEVGLRKVAGALKRHIIKQFYSESIIFALTALIFSLVLVSLALPAFNDLSGKAISFSFIGNTNLLLSLFGITLFTGIIAGSYPALYLSSFVPVKVLKGNLTSGAKNSGLRRTLVVIQFTLSIFLIIGTGVVYKQLLFMKNKDLGYSKDQMLYIMLRGDSDNFYPAFKNALVEDVRIAGVTAANHLPSQVGANGGGADWTNKDPDTNPLISLTQVDYDFTETMGIEVVQGRSFSKDFISDTSNAFIINEELLRIMGKNTAVGMNFSFWGVNNGRIIGVIKDYHFRPVREPMKPLALLLRPNNIYYALVKLKGGNIPETLDFVRSTWDRVVPGYPFEYAFLDETFERMYRTEERMGDLLKYFSILAVVIACLGLFGLASFTAEQRTKEIGIRKVLGAVPLSMILLLCKEFFQLVLISIIFAFPLAWYTMDSWQQDFAFRAGLGIEIFLGAGILAIVISLLTVAYQAVKAAFANPVKALKYE